jgi:hypothetical protein
MNTTLRGIATTHAPTGSALRIAMRWLTRALLGIGVLVVGTAMAGAVYEAFAWSRDAAAYPPLGRLVSVGGHRLHISCIGEGTPTVVFESGLANMSADWANVQPQVAATSRACAYDRAGIGWSDDGAQPRGPRRIAQELAYASMKYASS